MKKKFILGILLITMVSLTGCRESSRASYNLSKEADSFNVVRQITVINCLQGDVMFQMSGKMAIEMDEEENQLEVMIEDGDMYKKHFIGLSDNVTYIIEDIKGVDVDNYKYTIKINPEMWIPVNAELVE